MSAKIIKLLILCSCLCLAGCSSGLAGQNNPDIAVIRVQVSTAMTHWIPKLTTCSETNVDAGITVDILPAQDLNPLDADLVIRFGPKTDQEKNVSVLAKDKIVFIIDDDNPLTTISNQSLSDILLGKYQTWDQVPEIALLDTTYDLPISVFSYGSGSDLYPILSNSLLNGKPVNRDAIYSASWEILKDSVAKTPGSIGYLLESQVSGTVQTLQVVDQDDFPPSLGQPVIAVTRSEPEGALRQLLFCLQAGD